MIVFESAVGLNDVTKILGSLFMVCDETYRSLGDAAKLQRINEIYAQLEQEFKQQNKVFTFVSILEAVCSLKDQSFGAYIVQLCDPLKKLGSVALSASSSTVENAFCFLGTSNGMWSVGRRSEASDKAPYLFTMQEIEQFMASQTGQGLKPCFEVGSYVLYNQMQFMLVSEDATSYTLSKDSQELRISKTDPKLLTDYETAKTPQEIDNRASEHEKYKNVTFNGVKYGPRPNFELNLNFTEFHDLLT